MEWYQYSHDYNFGKFPDPRSPLYAKPDINFSDPKGINITVPPNGSGKVTSARIQPWDTGAWSITVKLDKPYNSVATHYAINYVSDVKVNSGSSVKPGDVIAVSGNPYNVGTALALCDSDVYGTATKNMPFSGAYINPLLNPSPFIDGVKSTNTNASNPLTVRAFMDQLLSELAGHFGQPTQITNFMIAWAQKEGGGVTNQAKFNPLNTKQVEQGGVDAGNGIQAYPDGAAGIKATKDALTNGLYPNLVHALSTNDLNGLGFGSNHGMAGDIANELIVWDFGHGSITNPTNEEYPLSIMALAGIPGANIVGGTVSSSQQAQNQNEIDAYGNKSLGDDTSGITVGGAVSNATGGLDALNSFFSGLSGFFSDPIRIVKIVGGSIFIIVGAALFIRQFVPSVKVG